MIYFILFSLSILVIPAATCEGQCIVGITHAFIGNYTTSVHSVFFEAATEISKRVLRSQSSAAVLKLMEPLQNAYQRGAYDAMEKAIFPSYFHGKCQVNGVDPAGCPNPDCPVVCGTPGSLVHFYNILQTIAFNTTAANLADLCTPTSSAYKAFESAAIQQLHGESRSRRSLHSNKVNSGAGLNRGLLAREAVPDVDVKSRLSSACKSMAEDLANQCGGKSNLSKCSWEQEMKTFILSFP